MSQHLSDEQISNWLIGERTADAEAHLRECAACRGEIARMEETFALFRESLPLRGSEPSRDRRGAVRPIRIAVALAASILSAALLFLRPAPTPSPAPFVAIPYVAPLAPYERTSVVRLNIPVAALVAAGFTVQGADPGATVSAEVIVGQDGRAHAVRLISNRSLIQ
jgi:hypothetical protein